MDRIDEAFKAVPRENFVLAEQTGYAGRDAPLPIGFGQTISQPTTVKMMLEWLEAEPGDKILDVGSGSGWTTALLAHLTGAGGQVQAVEIVPELVVFGRQNCRRLGIKNVDFHQAGQEYGWPATAPYDRILVSAAAQAVPSELLEQLGPDSKLVIPVGNDILEINKLPSGQTDQSVHSGFVFVPLIKPTP